MQGHWGYSLVVEHLLAMYKDLDSIASITNTLCGRRGIGGLAVMYFLKQLNHHLKARLSICCFVNELLVY